MELYDPIEGSTNNRVRGHRSEEDTIEKTKKQTSSKSTEGIFRHENTKLILPYYPCP